MFRLIDQHDRDIVFDGVVEAAGVAHEHFLGCRAVFQWSLALGAEKNRGEGGREAHPAYPRRLSDGAWRRHLGSTLTRNSRNTGSPSSASILPRAAWPSVLIVRPPAPITMPFWLSRST